MKDYVGEALDFLKDMVIIVVIVLVIRTFFVMPFQINGQSMYDSYFDKEFILVDRLSYRNIPLFGSLKDIERGDVVVFDPMLGGGVKYFIKRVVGLPGEQIKIEGGKVFIKEVGAEEFYELEESYLMEQNMGNTFIRSEDGTVTYDIPENRYIVLGDNRMYSTDSRNCFQSCATGTPFMNESQVVGKIFMTLGYFNFRSFSFEHPVLGISTTPRFFSSPSHHSF
ncbi:signal peptidase I [Candidatus Gracilibacteria bacterium]|nr:signal peptidase I [Candidatus Gracilibacteria bacterium]